VVARNRKAVDLPDLPPEELQSIQSGVGSGGTLLEQIPTPLARAQLRATRVASLERAERFNSLQYLSESLMKYSCLVLLSFLEVLDAPKAHGIAYGLSRGEGMGDWEQSLQSISEATRRAGAPQELRDLLKWFTSKRNSENDSWFREVFQTARGIWSQTSTDPLDLQPSIRGLFAFLAAFRNKTRGHGAKSTTFFEAVNNDFETILTTLLARCPLFTDVQLLWIEQTLDGLVQRPLRGPAPTDSGHLDQSVDLGLVVRLPSGALNAPFSPLLKYDPVNDGSYFANGHWRDSDFTAEALDYLTGETVRLQLSQFATPTFTLHRSETAGGLELRDGRHAGHNLPELFSDYVERVDLEENLRRLLNDKTHRIITLRGMGGVGKTSLALRLAHVVTTRADCPFLWIVWFSARDIDLTVAGPRQRRPEVTDIEDVAEYYCRLFGIAASGRDATTIFTKQVAESAEPKLLIMDNFESLTNQREAQQYLDEAVVLPNKVLITSRHERFQGDYPLEVKGMSDGEADSLMRSEAERLGCVDRLAPKVMQRIRLSTSNVPYALKLVVGQLQRRDLSIEQILRESLTHGDILEALFERSFESLSSESRQLYLLVGNWPAAIPTFAVRAVLGARGLAVNDAVDECRRSSLVMITERGETEWLETPVVSRAFARATLPAGDHSLEIERDLDFLRSLDVSNGCDTLPELTARIMSAIKAERNAAAREHHIQVLEALTGEDVSIWRDIATIKWQTAAPAGEVEHAFRHAVEADPGDWHTWYSYSAFEAQRGDYQREVELLIRACQRRPNDAKLNSVTAAKIAALISGNRPRFPLAERQTWTDAVRANLASMFDALDADALARLGWLYWLQNDRTNADRCAKRGLAVNKANIHCQNLSRRLEETARADYVTRRV
jgi:tetratricopeptide (TPR) repeat protein